MAVSLDDFLRPYLDPPGKKVIPDWLFEVPADQQKALDDIHVFGLDLEDLGGDVQEDQRREVESEEPEAGPSRRPIEIRSKRFDESLVTQQPRKRTPSPRGSSRRHDASPTVAHQEDPIAGSSYSAIQSQPPTPSFPQPGQRLPQSLSMPHPASTTAEEVSSDEDEIPIKRVAQPKKRKREIFALTTPPPDDNEEDGGSPPWPSPVELKNQAVQTGHSLQAPSQSENRRKTPTPQMPGKSAGQAPRSSGQRGSAKAQSQILVDDSDQSGSKKETQSQSFGDSNSASHHSADMPRHAIEPLHGSTRQQQTQGEEEKDEDDVVELVEPGPLPPTPPRSSRRRLPGGSQSQEEEEDIPPPIPSPPPARYLPASQLFRRKQQGARSLTPTIIGAPVVKRKVEPTPSPLKGKGREQSFEADEMKSTVGNRDVRKVKEIDFPPFELDLTIPGGFSRAKVISMTKKAREERKRHSMTTPTKS